MIPVTDNAAGIAALFVVPSGPMDHGMNYILTTEGGGLMCENKGGGKDWQAFDALPTETVTELNEAETEYESTRELSVAIADVADWTPWTILMDDGTWYYRSDVLSPWEEAAAGDESNIDTLPPRAPTELLPVVEEE